jgi:hypothetical protein
MEGFHCYNPANCQTTGLTLPIVEYDHGQGCSITGGVVYRGVQYGRMRGLYFYADYCNGSIWGVRRQGSVWQSRLLYAASFKIATFGEDESGETYVADLSGGVVYRMTDTGAP